MNRIYLRRLLSLAGCLILLGCSKEQDRTAASEDSGTQDAGKPACACEADQICIAGRCAEPGSPAFSGRLGDADGEFGVADVEEAESTAPASIEVSADGEQVYLLDQVNSRVSVYRDEDLERSIPIDTSSAMDLAVLGDGRLVLLDPARDELVVLHRDGARAAVHPISGVGVSSARHVTDIRSRQDGIWMLADRLVIHVLQADGTPVERRRMLTGLVSRDGESLLTVSRLADGSVNVVRRNTMGKASYEHTQLGFEHSAVFISTYDFDARGNIYLVTEHYWGDPEDAQAQTLLTVLSPALEPRRQTELFNNRSGRSVVNPIAIGPRGEVFQLHAEAEEVAVRRY